MTRRGSGARLVRIVVISLLGLALPLAAGATTIFLSSSMDGAQANAGTGSGSTGTGSATLTFDDQTNQLTWSGTFTGLLAPYTVSHFHGPALPTQNAGIVLGFGVVLDPGNRSGTFNGIANLTPSQAADLLNDLWYINIHSQFAPGGEIRGQVTVVPEPTTLLLTLSGMLGLAAWRRRG